MKLVDFIDARKIIEKTITGEQKLPAGLAYRLMKIVKATSEEEAFFNENIQKIIAECGEKDEAGNIIQEGDGVKIKEDKRDECKKRVDELYGVEVELPCKLVPGDLDYFPDLTVPEAFIIGELIEE